MREHTFFGKQKLCYTELSDFTDFQGIGRNPLYLRYDSVKSIVMKTVPKEYHHFLATPEFIGEAGQIYWHVTDWEEKPQRLIDLSGTEKDKYDTIFQKTINVYKTAIDGLKGEDRDIMTSALKFIDKNFVYGSDDKVYLVAWGMTPAIGQHKVTGTLVHEVPISHKYMLNFDVGEHGSIADSDKIKYRVQGVTLSAIDVPKVTPDEGWIFERWNPEPKGLVVKEDLSFVAQYTKIEDEEPTSPQVIVDSVDDEQEEEFFECRFDDGGHGRIDGSSVIQKKANTTIDNSEVPNVIPNKGYSFKCWDSTPNGVLVDEDKIFTAQYEEKIPWYKRFWLWLTGLFKGKGCLKWLLKLLIGLLILVLLWLLLKNCRGCTHPGEVNGVVPIDSVKRQDGSIGDDNGYAKPLTGEDGELPKEENFVAPLIDENGEHSPIIEQPGVPKIIANRLFLFLENENDDIESLARDFKKTYPGKQYSIIGYDKEIKMMVIQIPENERDQIRQTINAKIPNHKFIVFDEEIYEIKGNVLAQSASVGWHLSATHLQEAWKITQGSSNIKIAVVDDGIQASHPMFKGKIVDAYNVFTQNNKLSAGVGHGTHTAGLAAGSAIYVGKGAAGVAPNCKLMPIQVFDNGQCPLSALVAGVMYAVHHDADVVNLSICPSFSGLSILPLDQQEQIARSQFKNVEKLWNRVCSLAVRKNCILVFAAGNDKILSCVPPENRNATSIVVAAVDERLYQADFSNFGEGADISAPGKDIYSSFPTSNFKSCDGTSMSAPIVSGTIALMKSLKKDLTVEQVRNVLYKTGADVYGNVPPMVLIDKALEGIKRGDFSIPNKRPVRPIPGEPNDEDVFGNDNYSGNDGIIGDDGNTGDDGDDSSIGKQPKNPSQGQPNDETDYDAIRRMIEYHKQKIKELENLLPQK